MKTSGTQGLHFDDGKPDVSLLPPHALLAVSQIMTLGAKKYAADNYRNGIAFRKLLASALRHQIQWLGGENMDLESKESHLAHAGADILMLLQMMRDRPDLDDRWRSNAKQRGDEKVSPRVLCQEQGKDGGLCQAMEEF